MGNQLDPLLRATGDKMGDVADESGNSPYPGNINVLVVRLSTYVEMLKKSNGLMPEFVNPKYKDKHKTTFKKPTRVECMMQDYARLLSGKNRVGFIEAPRWIVFSAVKNNIVDAATKLRRSGAAESGSSGEFDMYLACRRYLAAAGVRFGRDKEVTYHDIQVPYGARCVYSPSFGVTLDEVKKRIMGKVTVSNESTLVLDGDIDIINLELDGALIIKACPGSKVIIKNLTVKNDGWRMKVISPDDESYAQKYRIRGYVIDKEDQLELNYPVPGSHIVDDTSSPKASRSLAQRMLLSLGGGSPTSRPSSQPRVILYR